MQSTLNPKQSDDPHDFVVVAPDAIRVAPADDELSSLLHDAARHLSESQSRTATGFPAGPPVPPVDAPAPLVDTTFRSAAVNDVQAPRNQRSMAKRALRASTALLVAACIGGAAIAWRTYGDAAEKKIAKWATQLVMTVSLPPEKPGPAAQVDAASAQPAPSAPSAVEAVAPTAAPSPDSAQSLQSMARDLASLGQEVVQLKAVIEQIKASQQASRDAAKASEAKASEQNPRPRISAPPPPRPVVARAHKPTPPLPSTQAAAPLPLAGAPYYVSRQIEPPPQGTVQPQPDPELESVPRPPMPVR